MTTVTFTLNADNKIIGFKSEGHSGFARRGKDIVCASISVLTINTINSLEKIAHVETVVNTDAKTAAMECILKDSPNVQTETLFRSLELGVIGIHENYGSKYCNVIYKED